MRENIELDSLQLSGHPLYGRPLHNCLSVYLFECYTHRLFQSTFESNAMFQLIQLHILMMHWKKFFHLETLQRGRTKLNTAQARTHIDD